MSFLWINAKKYRRWTKIAVTPIQVEYEVTNEVPTIVIFGINEKGERRIIRDNDFKPYFYILKNEVEKLRKDKRVLKIEEVKYKDIKGRNVVKVITKIPAYVKELREKVDESFEADVLYPTRYIIDKYNDLKGVPLSVTYLDIEVASNNRFPDIEHASDPINAITCFNNMDKKCITFVWRQDLQRKTVNNGTVSFKTVNEEDYKYKDFTLFFDNERDMLISFIKYVQKTDCDMFSGWNVKDFDMAYIINRMNSIGMDYRRLSPMNVALTNKYGDVLVKGRIIFDMLEAYRKMQYGELDSYRLDNVASHELGEKKIKYAGSLHSLWQDDLDKFIAYNKKDTMLVYRIEKKKKIVQTFDETRRLSKCSFNDVFNNSRVVDSFMLHFTKGKFVHPTKKHHRKQSFAGAFVLKPKKGIHKNSVVFDYTSLYPKIISSLNLFKQTLFL